MAIRERLLEDYKTAMKSGDKFRTETIRFLRAQFKDAEINRRGTDKPFNEEDEITVLMNAVKKRKEAIDLYKQGNRLDLAEKEQTELEIIQTYLPPGLTADEIEQMIVTAIQQIGATTPKDIGKVMSLVMKETRGRADGKVIQELVRKKLAG
jgi:hypothetical protein